MFNPLWSTRRVVCIGGRDISRMASAAANIAHAGSLLLTSRALLSQAAAAVVACALIAGMLTTPAFAQSQQTGQISGTITDATGKPVPGLTVRAAAPSASYSATTDARGFFAIAGVTPDTYVVSFSKTGLQPSYVEGVSVVPGQTSDVSQKLAQAIRTIGRTRSASGAFNPSASSDTYTVTESQIDQILGKANNTSETDLLASLPGVTIDSSGYPVLRGGRENEEGFQFEGMDYTDAFTHQFVNSLELNGTQALQLTPGTGDASTGNAGTGAINIIAKRGTYPPNGMLEYTNGSPGAQDQYSLEYGIATPTGNLSNYVSYTYQNKNYIYGTGQQNVLTSGNFFNENALHATNFVDNLIYKFGTGQNQSLQFFIQAQDDRFYLDEGGNAGLYFPTNDPTYLYFDEAFTGLTQSQLQAISPLAKGQTSEVQVLDRAPETYYQPNNSYKLQYSINLNSTTYLTAKYYQVNSVTDFDFPYYAGYVGLYSPFIVPNLDALQGGQQTTFALDGSKQLGDKNLLTFGFQYKWLHPVYSEQIYDTGPGILALTGYSVYDFVNSGTCPLTGGPATFGGAFTCGYLASQGITNAQVPIFDEYAANANRQDTAYYINDAFSPTSKLKITAGVRLDGAHYQLPACNINTCLPTNTVTNADGSYTYTFAQENNQTLRPLITEPRLAVNYSLTSRDAIRLQYGRSVQFAPLGDVDVQVNPAYFAKYANIPAYSALAGETNGVPNPVVACGTNGLRTCTSYADQLFWVYQDNLGGIPIEPVAPATFTNYEGSYSHDFGRGLAVKVTPFYRASTDDIVDVATPLLSNGKPVIGPTGAIVYNPPTASNLGTSKTTGVEFYLTKTPAEANAPGFSGQLSMTYINELSNVIPDSPDEDFFPSIPTQSLALGNIYRVGFLSPLSVSLATTYRTKGGLRINPIVRYNHGYPYGQGVNTAYYVGATPENVPNTNITNPNGSSSATQYVDPQNPGSLQDPNIAATRGTGETSSAGGLLTQAQFRTDLDIEYTTPRIHGTFGLFITNLFNNTYGNPTINQLYQPIATGIAGPQSGISPYTALFGSPYTNYTAFGGNDAYLLQQGNVPLTFNLYYQLKI